MMLLNSMSKEDAKKLYDMCKEAPTNTLVKDVMSDLYFFTDGFTKDYVNNNSTSMDKELLEDLSLEQHECR